MEIKAADFRANCFKLLDQVRMTHQEVVITKRGVPIAKLVHIPQSGSQDPLLGSLAGLVETLGDLTEPIMDSDAWELD